MFLTGGMLSFFAKTFFSAMIAPNARSHVFDRGGCWLFFPKRFFGPFMDIKIKNKPTHEYMQWGGVKARVGKTEIPG